MSRGHADGPQIASQLTDEATEAGVELGFGEVVQAHRLRARGRSRPPTASNTPAAPWWSRPASARARSACHEEASTKAAASPIARRATAPLYAGRPVVVAGTEGWARTRSGRTAGRGGRRHRDRQAGGVDCPTACIASTAASSRSKAATACSRSSSRRGGTRKTIPASAVFVYVGQSPAAEFLPETLARDATGHIVVDEEGRTSAATAFAVGDVRAGARHYLADAIADGQRAGQAIVTALKKN